MAIRSSSDEHLPVTSKRQLALHLMMHYFNVLCVLMFLTVVFDSK